jgi:hypothetical protein
LNKLRINCNKPPVSPALVGAVLAIATATIPATPTLSHAGEISPTSQEEGIIQQIDQYSNNSIEPEDALAQVTSVSQLTDVDPTHWAFQALQSLVERYGCIEGYPDRTYRGNRALTRYEFAAGLNACLDRIQELIAAAVSDVPSKEDIATIRRLQEEFRAELASLRGRVDALEPRIARLEAQQFSTTTKLAGEVIFAAAGIIAGENAFGEEIDRVPVLAHRTRLNFETSFSGKDLLRTRLQAGNLNAFSANNTLTPEGDLIYGAGAFGTGDSDIVLDELSYTFPLGDRTQVVLSANAAGSDSFTDTLNPFFDGDGASGSLSRFGTRHAIYYLADGTGIGLRHEFSDSVELSLGYRANSETANIPLDGNGLFNGPYGAIAQLTFKPSKNFKFGLTYVNSYNTDLGTGSRIANLRSYLADGTDARLEASGLQGSDLPISSNSYGFGLSWQISPGFALGGWAGYTNTRTLSTLGGQINRGEIQIYNAAVSLAFPDLGKKGNLAGIIVGVEPIADASSRLSNDLNNRDLGGDDDDVSFHIEALYQIQVTDNISITPGVIWLTAPDHNKNNDDVIIGTIRTTFSF